MKEKFKIGDKVRIINCRNMESIAKGVEYQGIETTVIAYENNNGYRLEGLTEKWYDDELELVDKKNDLFHAIIESAKQSSLKVELLKDGAIKISKAEENKDYPIDTPMMVCLGGEWSLRYYAGGGCCYCNSQKSKTANSFQKWEYTIPFDKFNPNDITNSLKYNINKYE